MSGSHEITPSFIDTLYGGTLPAQDSPFQALSFRISPDIAINEPTLKEIRDFITSADSFGFALTCKHPGVNIMSSAYLSALQQGIALLQPTDSSPYMTLFSSTTNQGVYRDYPGMKVVETNFRDVKKYDLEVPLVEIPGRKVVIFDFSYRVNGNTDEPLPSSVSLFQRDGKTVMVLHDLFGPLFTTFNADLYPTGDRYARAIEALLGLPQQLDPSQAQLHLPIASEAQRVATRRELGLPEQPQNEIAIALGGTQLEKRYSLQRWEETITSIHQQAPDYRFDIIYKDDGDTVFSRTKVKEMVRSLQNKGIICNLIETDLERLKDILTGINGLIGNDTSVTHLAIALGIPSVALYRSIVPISFSPRLWRSHSSLERIVSVFNSSSIDDIAPSQAATTLLNFIGHTA